MKKLSLFISTWLLALCGLQALAAESLFLTSELNNWAPGDAEYAFKLDNNVFFIDIDLENAIEAKLTITDNWDVDYRGDVTPNTLISLSQGGANMVIPAGTWRILVKKDCSQMLIVPKGQLYVVGEYPGTTWDFSTAVKGTSQGDIVTWDMGENAPQRDFSVKFIYTTEVDWADGLNNIGGGNLEVNSTIQGVHGGGNIIPKNGTKTLSYLWTRHTVSSTGEVAPQPDELYLKTSADNWESSIAMTKGDNGLFTVTQALPAGVEFKFVDENGDWWGSLGNNTSELNEGMVEWGTPLFLRNDPAAINFSIPIAGEWTFTVDKVGDPDNEDVVKREPYLMVTGFWPYNDVYVLSSNNDWNAAQADKMSTQDGIHYTLADFVVNDAHEGYGYFRFTWTLGGLDIGTGTPFGANTESGDFLITEEFIDKPITLLTGEKAFQIPAGTYTLLVDLQNMQLRVTGQATIITDDLYLFGQSGDNGNEWDATAGIKLEKNQDGLYTFMRDFVANENGLAKFRLGTVVAQVNDEGGWEYVNNHMIGISAGSEVYYISEQLQGEIQRVLTVEGDHYDGDEPRSFTVDPGTYYGIIDLENRTIVLYPVVSLQQLLTQCVNGRNYYVDTAVAAAHVTDGGNIYASDGTDWVRIDDAPQGYADNVIPAVIGKLQNRDTAPSLTFITKTDLEKDVVVEPEVATVEMSTSLVPQTKLSQVVDVVGFWDGENLRAEKQEPQGQSLTIAQDFAQATLEAGKCYLLRVGIELKEPWPATGNGAPRKAYNEDYENLKAQLLNSEEITITGVDDLAAESVANVKYVNLAGQVSATPFAGMNIRVTTLADGTTKAVKVVK